MIVKPSMTVDVLMKPFMICLSRCLVGIREGGSLLFLRHRFCSKRKRGDRIGKYSAIRDLTLDQAAPLRGRRRTDRYIPDPSKFTRAPHIEIRCTWEASPRQSVGATGNAPLCRR